MSNRRQPERRQIRVPDQTTEGRLRVVDLTSQSEDRTGKLDGVARGEAEKATEDLHRYGLAVVYDPALNTPEIDAGREIVARFFASPAEFKQGYTVPNGQAMWTEGGREYSHVAPEVAARIKPEHLPPTIDFADGKERYFDRLGDTLPDSPYPDLDDFPEVREPFEGWRAATAACGNRLLDAGKKLHRLVEHGLGLRPGELQDDLEYGAHLYGPTGFELTSESDLYKGEPGDIIAGPHTDLGRFAVHTASYMYCPETGEIEPCGGLMVWDTEEGGGEPLLVRVPRGHALVQSGQDIERETDGYFRAGLHAVIVTSAMADRIAAARSKGHRLYRCSCSVFVHPRTPTLLKQRGRFRTSEAARRYPPILKGEYMRRELKVLNLDRT